MRQILILTVISRFFIYPLFAVISINTTKCEHNKYLKPRFSYQCFFSIFFNVWFKYLVIGINASAINAHGFGLFLLQTLNHQLLLFHFGKRIKSLFFHLTKMKQVNKERFRIRGKRPQNIITVFFFIGFLCQTSGHIGMAFPGTKIRHMHEFG